MSSLVPCIVSTEIADGVLVSKSNRSLLCRRSWADCCSRFAAGGPAAEPPPAGLPPVGELLGAFPASYSLPGGPGGLADAAERRAALGVLLQTRGAICSAAGAAFMPCVLRPLGADAAAEATAAARVLHVLTSGLAAGLWAAVPPKGPLNGAPPGPSARTASMKHLAARITALQVCRSAASCTRALCCVATCVCLWRKLSSGEFLRRKISAGDSEFHSKMSQEWAGWHRADLLCPACRRG